MSRARKMVALAAGAALVAGGAYYVLARRARARKASRILLPTNIKPTHYTLRLEPDLEAFTFKGFVDVTVRVLRSTRVVVCHANELSFSRVVAVTAYGEQAARSVVVDADESAQTVTATFAKRLPVGPCMLRYFFEGTLNDKMAGFYRSSYAGADGSTRYMAVTQFEATDARRAFPCWDEPALKATFDVSLRVPTNRTALSNMPPFAEVSEGDKKLVTFATTPVMSTYLVAFCVGEFDCVESSTKEGVTVRVWTPPGLGEQGRFALECGCACLSFFTEYFGQPYPLPKMDMVAVPDFAAGAMENWGLVTYRTVLVLYDAKTTGTAVRQQIAYVVAHELAHQWFGNLVTMEWWTDLWLNEGFATWAGWRAVDAQFPSWRVWDQFLANEQARGLELDALASSHPVEVEVLDASRVNEVFDAISYSKGASVIFMLVAYLGEPAFKAGMRRYVAHHALGNATTSDLWAALGADSGKPVASVMACWTRQTGFPCVRVARAASHPGTLLLSQSRFRATGEARGDGSKWEVPLRIVSSSSPSSPSADVLSDGAGCAAVVSPTGWVKLNAGQAGFYRVAYSPDMWAPLSSAAASLPAADRAGLAGDAFALAAAGAAPTSAALALVRSLCIAPGSEADYTVWASVAAGLSCVQSAFFEASPSLPGRLEGFSRAVYGPRASSLGWKAGPKDGHLDGLLRALVVGKAATAGDASAVAASKDRVTRFAAGDESALPPDLRAGAFKAFLSKGGAKEFDILLDVYSKAGGPAGQELRVAVLSSLGSSPDGGLVRRALNWNLRGGSVRSQDLPFIVASAASNPAGRRVAWDHLRASWADLLTRLGTGGFLLSRLVALSTASLASEPDAADIDAFFAQHGTPAVQRTVAQSVEKVRAAARWVRRDAGDLDAWLKGEGF